MGFECMGKILASKRLRGFSEIMFANKRKLQQALVLSVQQVKSLHATLEDGEADAVVAHTHTPTRTRTRTHEHAHADAHARSRTHTQLYNSTCKPSHIPFVSKILLEKKGRQAMRSVFFHHFARISPSQFLFSQWVDFGSGEFGLGQSRGDLRAGV